jgi:hypothetical protein
MIVEDTGEERRPFKFCFSNLPGSTSLRRLVTLSKLRWRVKRDHQELKREIGLDPFEGRTWRGATTTQLLRGGARIPRPPKGAFLPRRVKWTPAQGTAIYGGYCSSGAEGVPSARDRSPLVHYPERLRDPSRFFLEGSPRLSQPPSPRRAVRRRVMWPLSAAIMASNIRRPRRSRNRTA